jgi:type IV pilus assembly protein PilM
MSSFLKKELSLPRPKGKSKPEPEGEQKTPFWKKEVSLGRGERAPKPTRAEKKAKRVEPKAVEEKREKPEKQPKAPKAPKAPRARHGKTTIVGLKIGASQIAAARVANNGSVELLQVARQPLEPGVVVGGELQDAAALSAALKSFFRKHKLPKRGVRLGIANNRIGVRIFELEGIDDPKQLANAIRFRAQEVLPIPVDEAVLDYRVLDERTDENGVNVRRVLLVVAYRDLIERYVDACRKAGLRLVGIDLEAFALLRALGAPPQDERAEAATVAVSVGHDRSTLAVSDGRVCEFTRVLNWGGATVDATVAEALQVELAEAEAVKRALSLGDDAIPEGLSEEQATDAREAIRRTVWAFARELVSSLQFYQSQAGSLEIAGLTVTGGSAHLPGLAEELATLIGVPVTVGDPLARVTVREGVSADEHEVGSLAVAIGLGIED